ncbi:MAG TPA: FMN-binding negative transcriptional regulator [Ilumatobacter sp.]|nr:FMN-binding negative transcriptional regulator [Ilumatobacter sp.]
MYLPQHFREDDTVAAVAMARRAGFGHLVVAGPDGLSSTPLPFLISDAGTQVRAHLARPNSIWKLAPCDALLIVPVDDNYISPSWYPSKAEHGKVVPTWNYEVVHLHGRLVARDDAEWTSAMVRDLTDLHEATLPTPWSVDDAPPEYVEQLMRGIVGIELEVSRIEAKRKLSQNKSDADRAGIAAALAERKGV